LQPRFQPRPTGHLVYRCEETPIRTSQIGDQALHRFRRWIMCRCRVPRSLRLTVVQQCRYAGAHDTRAGCPLSRRCGMVPVPPLVSSVSSGGHMHRVRQPGTRRSSGYCGGSSSVGPWRSTGRSTSPRSHAPTCLWCVITAIRPSALNFCFGLFMSPTTWTLDSWSGGYGDLHEGLADR
jgi:hypothetical protein